ncbi:FAD-binding domain-containing protein [Gigaspora margarita]|uniref:FAD-binding domain-containing protein n=1 Tax=Gigaspora margarita TaxID=4874 RepID=A0A8H4B572_GIGMA|nr:FAD-binding domain-containing protein [Gigaspora margarita]
MGKLEWRNSYSPNAIFEPSTLEDLVDIVKLAKINNKKIRCISLSDLDETPRNHDPPLNLDSEILYNTVRVSGVVAVGAHGDKTNSGIMSDQLCSMKSSLALGNIAYWPFNGFNLSDPNPLDSNRDRVGIKNWIRTDEPVNFTQQQLEQLHEVQKHDVFQQYKLISTSEESAKFDFVEIGFKVDPDFSNVAAEFSYVIQTESLLIPHWGKKWEFIPKVESYLSDVLSNQIKTI